MMETTTLQRHKTTPGKAIGRSATALRAQARKAVAGNGAIVPLDVNEFHRRSVELLEMFHAASIPGAAAIPGERKPVQIRIAVDGVPLAGSNGCNGEGRQVEEELDHVIWIAEILLGDAATHLATREAASKIAQGGA